MVTVLTATKIDKKMLPFLSTKTLEGLAKGHLKVYLRLMKRNGYETGKSDSAKFQYISLSQEIQMRENDITEAYEVSNEKPETPFEYYPYASYVKGRKTRGSKEEWKIHKSLAHAKNALTGGRNVGRKPAGEIYEWNPASEEWDIKFAISPGDDIPWQ